MSSLYIVKTWYIKLHHEPRYLIETCRAGQDKFRQILEYYRIEPGMEG